jgi:hypothetical protein
MPLERESRPSGGTRAAKSSAKMDYHQSSGNYQHSTLTATERAVQAARELLESNGYGIAARCIDCHHVIASPSSLAQMRGPRCAARHAGAVTL